MKQQQIIISILIAIVMGSAGFFGGMKYQESKNSFPSITGRNRTFTNGTGQRMMQGRTGGMMPINGEITAQDSTSITVKMRDGSSKIVIFSNDTSINKTEKGSKSDLTTGTTITAFGNTNSDGSLTAQSISIGSMFGQRDGVQIPQRQGTINPQK